MARPWGHRCLSTVGSGAACAEPRSRSSPSLVGSSSGRPGSCAPWLALWSGPVAEMQPDGLDALRDRLDRRPRSIPPTRHPRPQDSSDRAAVAGAERVTPRKVAPAPRPQSPHARPETASGPPPTDLHPPATPGEPLANLALRPRRSLDNRLADLVHALRREGIRTSKVELVELLLWELPPELTSELRARLTAFRRQAPREPLL